MSVTNRFLPYLLVQSEVPPTVPSAAIWRKTCVLPKRRTSIWKEDCLDPISLICRLIVKEERRWRDGKRFARRQATTGSIDAIERCFSTAERQTHKVKRTRRNVYCNENNSNCYEVWKNLFTASYIPVENPFLRRNTSSSWTSWPRDTKIDIFNSASFFLQKQQVWSICTKRPLPFCSGTEDRVR